MFDAFMRMDSNRRVLAIAAAFALLVVGWFAYNRAMTPEYVTLFRDLDVSGVGNITDHLTKATIPYRLQSEGTEVQVPKDDAARARVLLAADGLPATGRPGMELFDKPAWGMTDFTQHITYRRALEGELARTIGTLRGVQNAQVHLALPEATALQGQQRPPEAAVVLKLASNVVLTPEQVQGITQLVSGSVEQLTPDHVTVLDDTGRPLTGNASDNAGLTSRQLDMQSKVEQHLANKVQELLASTVAPADMRVQVAARLNFDQVERSIDTYDPNGKVLQNEQKSSGGDSASAETAGTVINNTYVNSRTVQKIVAETGNITRLTVSVMLNSRALKSDADAQRASLTEVVRNAIGIDSTRGDQLSVVAVPFTDIPTAKTAVDSNATKEPGPSIGDLLAKFGGLALAVVAVILFGLIGWRAAKPSLATALISSGNDNADPTLRADERYSMGAGRRPGVEHVSSPDAAAQVIRAWLTESS
ncbi:MAG TPA: flagellar basal-body MS-ring/collar protein FliF [Gemmatimonadales bacterium]|jgi:flagellar M-ring protein FliF